MKEYNCENCKKIFNRKSTYIYHINKKNSCLGESTNIKNILSELKLLKQENIQLKHEIISLKDNKLNISNTQNNNNIDIDIDTQNNNNIDIDTQNNIDTLNNNVSVVQIVLNKYGNENMDHMNEQKCKNILDKGFKSIPHYIECVHFNDMIPSNKNICITNRRDNTVNVYNGTKWILTDKQEFLDEIKEKGIDFIERNIEDLNENNANDKKILTKINRFLMSYKGNSEQMKKIDKDIQLILYNNRHVLKLKNNSEIKK